MCQKYKSQLLNRWFENHFSESRTIHKQSTDQHDQHCESFQQGFFHVLCGIAIH